MREFNTKKSLHIQNDQTGTDGTFQRNAASDLFMQGPGGISQFTNFNDRATTLGIDRFDKFGEIRQGRRTKFTQEAGAFAYSPYLSDTKSVYGLFDHTFGGARSSEEAVEELAPQGLLSLLKFGKVAAPHEFIVDERLDALTPSDVKILDDMAFVSYNNHSQEVYLANEPLQEAYLLIKTSVAHFHDFSTQDTTLSYGLYFPRIGTLAKTADQLLGRDGSSSSNAGRNIGYRFRIDLHELKDLLPGTPDEDNFLLGEKEISFDGDIKRGSFMIGEYVGDGATAFVHTTTDMEGTEIFFDQGFVHPMPVDYDDLISKEDLHKFYNGRAAAIARTDTVEDKRNRNLGGNPEPDVYIMKVDVSDRIKDGSFFYKKGTINRCGRVDVYERRKGGITAVDGNKITITGPSGDGTYDTKLLSDGDKIKIVSALGDVGKDTIHPINGVKYVKRTAVDTEYLLYNDKDFSQPTTTSGLRDLTSISWAYYEGTQQTGGSWRYKTTLFSPNGLNGDGVTDTASYVVAGEDPKQTTPYTTDAYFSTNFVPNNYDAQELLPEAYRFGQSLDVIKQPGTDHYWLAIGEIGNTYSSEYGINYHQEYHTSQIDELYSNESDTKVQIPRWGHRLQFPEHEPYGRVWLYKIDTSNDLISAINTPEEINASTYNPYIKAPPFLDGGVDFSEFTDYRNLYWHRAMVSNFISEGDIGDLFARRSSRSEAFKVFKHPRDGFLPEKSSGALLPDMVYRDRGKRKSHLSRETFRNYKILPFGDIEYIEDERKNLVLEFASVVKGVTNSWLGERKANFTASGADSPQEDNFFLNEVFPYYRYNNGVYSDGRDVCASEYLEELNSQDRPWGEISRQFFPVKKAGGIEEIYPSTSTIKPRWMTNGYKFSDGFGFNLCMKVDDVTNGEKPIIAISNTTFPYSASISISVDRQLQYLQTTLDVYKKKKGYEDPFTQAFIDRHTKSNEFIRDFCSDDNQLASRFAKGSIFICNPNTGGNPQELEHHTRVHHNIAQRSNVVLQDYVDWYMKPPTMLFRDGMLFVGNDEGNIKVFNQGEKIDLYYKNTKPLSPNSHRTKIDLRRFRGGTPINPLSQLSRFNTPAIGENVDDYHHFSEAEKLMTDEYHFGEREARGNYPTYKYAIEGWVYYTYRPTDWNEDSEIRTWTLHEKIALPSTDIGQGNADWFILGDEPGTTRTQSTTTKFTAETIQPQSEMIRCPIYGIHDTYRSSPKRYIISEQLKELNDSDLENLEAFSSGSIFLSQSFGYNFRYDNGILLGHAPSDVNDFGVRLSKSSFTNRLYVYNVKRNGSSKFIQKITPALPLDIVGGMGGSDSYSEGSISVENTIYNSATIRQGLMDMYDILDGKIVMLIAGNPAVFGDGGSQTSPNYSPAITSIESDAYFSFKEVFNPKKPFNLNNLYTYNKGEGTSFATSVFDVNDRHTGLCAFYNVESEPKDSSSIRVVTGARITVLATESSSSQNGTAMADIVLPSLAVYKDDPRKTIAQIGGNSSSSKITFGPESSTIYKYDAAPLYQNGMQDSMSEKLGYKGVRRGSWKKSSLDTDGWVGTFNLTEQEMMEYVINSKITKDSSSNRTIRDADGLGNKTGSYIVEFNDANKDTFDSNVDVESTLVLGLVSHNFAADFGGLKSPAYRVPWEDIGKSISEYRRPDEILNYIPYSKPSHPELNDHSFINKAQIQSIQVFYKDYELAKIRKFGCRAWSPKGYEGGAVVKSSFIKLGSSNTPAFYDDTDKVYTGTSSQSTQLLHFPLYNADKDSGDVSQLYLSSITSADFMAADIQKPEFLSLSILSLPASSGDLTTSVIGSAPASGLMTMQISGVTPFKGDTSLYIGPLESKQFLGTVLPSPFDFKCSTTSLFMPTPLGDFASSTADLVFAGGSGVSNTTSLFTGAAAVSGVMNLGIGQSAPSSGNMNIAVSGVHGSYNSIPCMQGNLYMNSTFVDNSDMTIQMGRIITTAEETLFIGSPDPASGILGLNINTAPTNSGLDLYNKGYDLSSTTANLYIGEQSTEGLATLFLMQPHRLPFEDPRSPAVLEPGDEIQIPPLYISGAAIPSANSLDNNYEHQKQIRYADKPFDKSPRAESLVSYTSSNSISRNALDAGNTNDYGIKRISDVGARFSQYTGVGSFNFYENEVSRESIDSNGSLLAIGGNTNVLSSQPKLDIFNILDSDSVELHRTYTDFNKDLISLGIINKNQSVSLYFKDVKVSDKSKIAVSARVSVGDSISDMIFILEDTSIEEVTTRINEIKECTVTQPPRFSSEVTTEERWGIVAAFTSDSWQGSDNIINKLMGTSIEWKGEDLYYDKQSAQFASVYTRYESDNYASEEKTISVFSISDMDGYVSNINNIPEGTKLAFGAKIKIVGDLAFVASPLLDPYIANNNLSGINAASPDGAVHIFKDNSGWSYVDSVYSGGYTTSTIAGLDGCAYDAKLFGYDIDYNEGSSLLAVSEPISNTAYQFSVNDAGIPSLLNSYTNSNSRYGTFVNSSSRSLITNASSSINDAVYNESISFSSSELTSEIQSYISQEEAISSVAHDVVLARSIDMKGTEALLAVRDFVVDYGAGKTLEVQKISLFNLKDINGTLFIAGPLSSTATTTLVTKPIGAVSGDLGITFSAYGTGNITSLYMKTPEPASGAPTLHMRGPIFGSPTLFLDADMKPVSGIAPLATFGPSGISTDASLSISAHRSSTLESSLHALGGAVEGMITTGAFGLRVGQRDVFNASGTQDFLMTGNVNANPVTGVSLYMGAGDFGPSSGISPLRVEGPEKLEASGITFMRLQVDPASGPSEAGLPLLMKNTQAEQDRNVNKGWGIESSDTSLSIMSHSMGSGNMNLRLHRKGVGGGFEVESDTSLYIKNITDSGNANVYISGAAIASQTATLVIPSGIGDGSGNLNMITFGY